MRLLDLFCGAGGAAMGYFCAGFEVYGVDDKPQPRYPFKMYRADWQDIIGLIPDFDCVHASPPCEAYSQLTPKKYRQFHKDLIADVRGVLRLSGKPYIIENVPSAARLLDSPIMLCGSMFGLRVRRHRFFECQRFTFNSLLPPCDHSKAPVLVSGTHRRTYEPRYEYSAQDCREAGQWPWMTRSDMDKAIPPAYTEWIGKQLIQQLKRGL